MWTWTWRAKKVVLLVTELIAALITIHGLCTFLADVYDLLDQQIRSNRPRKAGESHDQLVQGNKWLTELDHFTRLIKEVIYIRKEGAQSTNRD